MKSHIAAILAAASVLVISGGLASAWHSALSETVLDCNGEAEYDIENDKDEWQEFETRHTDDDTRSPSFVVSDLEQEKAANYKCKDCPGDMQPCEKGVDSEMIDFEWLDDEDPLRWRWKAKGLTLWVTCAKCD